MPEPERRRRLLYGRRKGPKLSAHQQALRQTLLPRLALQLVSGLDPRRYFSPPPCGEVDDVWLEVGFGAGEHLFWQAEHNPRIGLIGAEPFENGIAKLLSKIAARAPSASLRSAPPPQAGEEKRALEKSAAMISSPVHGGRTSDSVVRAERSEAEGVSSNIKIYEGDGRDIIEALPDASISRFFLLFPDPWPKTRHHKRRFLQMAMLDQLARVLKPGAELRFATDDKSYLPYALERLMAHPQFEWAAKGPKDWTSRPIDWPRTRYEAKAIKGPPTFLSFRRVAG